MILDKFFSDSFTLYTGLFAAIFGMAFPLMLQCIERIDEKYNSSYVSQVFEKEWSYRMFQWLLFPYIILVCATPLIIGYLEDSKIYAFYFQGFMLLYILLVAVLMVVLYKRITTYYNIDKLISSTKIENPNKDALFCFDLAKYALSKGYQEFYIKAMTLVAECFQKERMSVEKDKPVEYSDNLYRILQEVGRNLRIQDSPLDHKFSDVMSFVLDSTDDHFLSDKTYNFIWYMLNNASVSENTGWIHDYWTWAVQYHQFKSNNVVGGPHNPEMRKFLLYNVMLGAVLTFNKRYECIAHMMSYSQIQPLKFPLVPGTFAQILTLSKEIDSLMEKPMAMEARFQMLGLKKGVNTDSAIFAEAMKYMALLFVRMWSYQDYNINYCRPLDEPFPSNDSIDENETNIRLMQIIEEHIRYYYSTDTFENLNLTIIPELDEVCKRIDSFIDVCEKKIVEINQRKGYDQQKLKHIYDDAVVSNSSANIDIPSNTDVDTRENTAVINTVVTASIDVERRFLHPGKGAECGGIGSGLSLELNLKIRQEFFDHVLREFNVTNETFDRETLDDKLNAIVADGGKAIFDLGGGIGNIVGTPVYNIGKIWFKDAVFVCDIDNIPTLDICENISGCGNIELIDDCNSLFASVSENPENYTVSIMQGISIEVIQGKPMGLLIYIG